MTALPPIGQPIHCPVTAEEQVALPVGALFYAVGAKRDLRVVIERIAGGGMNGRDAIVTQQVELYIR